MSFAGATAAANHRLKQNAELLRKRSFLGEVDREWSQEYLQQKYQAEVLADRRNRRIGLIVGMVGIGIIFYWLGYFLG